MHISSVPNTDERGDYVFKIDLQHAYFHIGLLIHPDSRKYLRFAFENKVYEFQVLTFGAPQVFTRLGHTVAAYQSQLVNTLNVVGFKLKRNQTRSTSGYPVSGTSLTPESGESFPPNTSIQGLGDNSTFVPGILPDSRPILSYREVSRFMRALN